jgi:protein TonB
MGAKIRDKKFKAQSKRLLVPYALCLVWISSIRASHCQSIAMTNKEILHADLLDILFENRNKAYGAYALRKNYSHRLQWALGISLSIALLISILGYSPIKKSVNIDERNGKEVEISNVQPIEPKKVEPLKIKTEVPRKQIAYTDQVEIVPDNMKTEMPDVTDFIDADISTKTVDGLPSSDTVQASKTVDVNGTSGNEKSDKPDFRPTTSDAQFPGGVTAFTKFLTKYLKTPGELADGEKKVVLVRFMVDADGTISKTEILQSDGEEYSKEVIRVLSKMPKWIPAMQNGTKVATWFTQPVSFIGVE